MAGKVAQIWQTGFMQQLQRDFKRHPLTANAVVTAAMAWANTLAAADVIESREDAIDFLDQLVEQMKLAATTALVQDDIQSERDSVVVTSLPFTF